MIITLSIWRPHLFAEQLKYAEEHNITVTKVIYFGQWEPTHWTCSHSLIPTLLDYVIKLEIPLYIIINDTVDDINTITDKYENVKIIKWETFWFSNIWSELATPLGRADPLSLQYRIDFYNFLTTPNIANYHYVFLNNHPHHHKAIMMDFLAKYDLIKYGAVSWLQGNGLLSSEELQRDLTEYQYKYWSPKFIKLDINSAEEVNYYRGKIPKQYNYAFMHLVSESSSCDRFISEKTPMPLLSMKPFLVIGGQGFHAHLKELGFKLYDEVFDYEFDSRDTIEGRCVGIAENIRKISGLSTQSLRNLYNILLNKLKHNRKLALSFATTIPDEVKEINNMRDQYIDPEFDLDLFKIIDD